jgi:hypothetical protein
LTHTSLIETVTFEPGSKLRKIEDEAFSNCPFLNDLFIPASVTTMTQDALPPSVSCRITIEQGNQRFLIDLTRHSIVRYSREGSEVTIPDKIETIDSHCFPPRNELRSVVFRPNSRLLSIAADGFRLSDNLEAIRIPSTVSVLGEKCFRGCWVLRTVSFYAFDMCFMLQSILLPASVKTLGFMVFF